MLSVRSLDVFYGRAQVLFGVGFEVPRGQVVALMGRNGAGKSTTLQAIMGLVPVERGEIEFERTRIERLPSSRIARLGLGYVPEDRRLFPDLTVAENLAVGRRPPASGGGWSLQRIHTLFPNLRELHDRRAGRTSGGEQQMLALARTLMGNPQLLLLDEPSEGLAPVIVRQMTDSIRTLQAEGVTVLLAEQSLRFARAVADRAVVLEKGHVRFAGSMEELAADPELGRTYLSV